VGTYRRRGRKRGGILRGCQGRENPATYERKADGVPPRGDRGHERRQRALVASGRTCRRPAAGFQQSASDHRTRGPARPWRQARTLNVGPGTISRWLARAGGHAKSFSEEHDHIEAPVELQLDEMSARPVNRPGSPWVFNCIEVASRYWAAAVVGDVATA
jgi:hypothetical protein